MARRPSTANVCSSIKDRDALMPATIRKFVKMGPHITDSVVPLGSSVLHVAQCLRRWQWQHLGVYHKILLGYWHNFWQIKYLARQLLLLQTCTILGVQRLEIFWKNAQRVRSKACIHFCTYASRRLLCLQCDGSDESYSFYPWGCVHSMYCVNTPQSFERLQY